MGLRFPDLSILPIYSGSAFISLSLSLSLHSRNNCIYLPPTGFRNQCGFWRGVFVLVLEMQFKSSLFFLLVAIDLTLTVAVLDPLLLRGREVEKG